MECNNEDTEDLQMKCSWFTPKFESIGFGIAAELQRVIFDSISIVIKKLNNQKTNPRI